MEDETMVRLDDSEEEHYFLRSKRASLPLAQPKDNTKAIIKINPSLNLKLKPKIVYTLELSLNVKMSCRI